MKTFQIAIKFDDQKIIVPVEADEWDEAFDYIMGNIEIFDNEENLDLSEVCPECGNILQNKMIDIDTTNIQEMKVCENCDYSCSPSENKQEKSRQKDN